MNEDAFLQCTCLGGVAIEQRNLIETRADCAFQSACRIGLQHID